MKRTLHLGRRTADVVAPSRGRELKLEVGHLRRALHPLSPPRGGVS